MKDKITTRASKAWTKAETYVGAAIGGAIALAASLGFDVSGLCG